jgi:hypothetical protein
MRGTEFNRMISEADLAESAMTQMRNKVNRITHSLGRECRRMVNDRECNLGFVQEVEHAVGAARWGRLAIECALANSLRFPGMSHTWRRERNSFQRSHIHTGICVLCRQLTTTRLTTNSWTRRLQTDSRHVAVLRTTLIFITALVATSLCQISQSDS